MNGDRKKILLAVIAMLLIIIGLLLAKCSEDSGKDDSGESQTCTPAPDTIPAEEKIDSVVVEEVDTISSETIIEPEKRILPAVKKHPIIKEETELQDTTPVTEILPEEEIIETEVVEEEAKEEIIPEEVQEIVSAESSGDTIINGIECVFVEQGNSSFYIGKYEVTQAQYQKFTGYNPSRFKGDNLPVENISWQNAVDFCKSVGGFLPTQEQWEFAAKGGNKSKGYEYSGSNNINEVALYWDNSGGKNGKTQPVGQMKPNELGIYDCSGNVLEWTMSADGDSRIVRGGSWFSIAKYNRVDYKYSYLPSRTDDNLGFRVAFRAESR